MPLVFDGPGRLITLSSGTVSLSVTDVWSRWVDWLAVGDNSKFLPAFSTVGGDVIDAGAGTSIPTYAFLLNGWRLKPQSANHTLNVSGGVLLVSGGGDPFVNPDGSYVVRINYSQPVQAVTVATGGGGGASAEAILAAEIESGVTAKQVLRALLATKSGAASGGGSVGPIVFHDPSGTTPRVTLNVLDRNGNRGNPDLNL